jgi:BASS family bile acid:Na+ symporter
LLIIIMFVVALDINWSDWKDLRSKVWSYSFGLVAQIMLLPAMTFALCQLFDLRPEIKLALILVASCPGGNLSNYVTSVAKGDLILSILLSFTSSIIAPLSTPFNFQFWANQSTDTAALFKMITVDPWELFLSIALTLLLPLAVGSIISWRDPRFAERLKNKISWIGPAIMIIFFIAGVAMNFKAVQEKFMGAFIPVVLINGAALIVFYVLPRLFRINKAASKTISIEVAIQNSGLGLMIILQFFPDQTDMALIAAIWGLWHLVSGLTAAHIWKRQA